MYKHFLILYSFYRILSTFKLATLKTQLMPHLYGPCSQTMNIHNLYVFLLSSIKNDFHKLVNSFVLRLQQYLRSTGFTKNQYSASTAVFAPLAISAWVVFFAVLLIQMQLNFNILEKFNNISWITKKESPLKIKLTKCNLFKIN